MPTAKCEVCGICFYVSPGHERAGWNRFCSRSCMSISFRKEGNGRWGGPAGDVQCRYCGKTFHIKPSAIHHKAKVYCSPECHKAHLRREYQCKHCGREFSVPASRERKGNVVYCSEACYLAAIAPIPNRKCLHCGKPFYVKQSDLKQRGKKGAGKFCSMECKARYMSCHADTSRSSRRAHPGKRIDLGIYVRSGWEANYARYLNWLVKLGEIKCWEYEADTFEFESIRRGCRFYTPDFKITNNDDSQEYHEVKGYMDPKSATKLRRMSKYHPDIKVVLIDKSAYEAIASQVKRFIPSWE